MSPISRHQVHLGRLDWDGVPAPVQLPRRRTALFKPPAAFWTSSLRDDGGTAWDDQLAEMGRDSPSGRFVFEVVGEPRLLVLHEDGDLGAAVRSVGLAVDGDLVESFIDRTFRTEFWDRTAAAYDGVHVPDGFDMDAIFSSWDCESTAWFRPSEKLRLHEVLPKASRAGMNPM